MFKVKITTSHGEVINIRPGANLAGVRIASVELTSEDFTDERVFDWLCNIVYPRMVPIELHDNRN